MFNNNRHLNIFEHYSQANALPIENNISRGLAILLSENALVLDRFIDWINGKHDNSDRPALQKPQRPEELDVGIQQTIKNIAANSLDPQQIIGITLTTAVPVEWVEEKRKSKDTLIADIVVGIKDSLVIIEVKRNATDARAQLWQQVDSIVHEILLHKGKEPKTLLLDGTWEELISVLQDCHSMQGNLDSSILGHYLRHLENRYQSWFPVASLSDIDIARENETAISKRILKLIQNCCENEDDEKKYSGRYMIPLDCNFAGEAQLDMDYDKKSLMLTVLPGDTKWQGYNLFHNTQNSLAWIYDEEIIVGEHTFAMMTDPYLRLAHFQSSIVIEYLQPNYYKENIGTDKSKCISLYQQITKEWKRENWGALKSILLDGYAGLVDKNSFLQQFEGKFINSNRGYTHVSFGYETTIYIPHEIVSTYEKRGGPTRGQDKLAELVTSIIQALLEKIR